MIVGTYSPGKSLLHRLDPRVKLVLLLTAAVSFFLPFPLEVSAGYCGALLALTAISLGGRALWIPLRTILPILILVSFLTPPFHPGGTVLAAPLPFYTLTTGGLAETARLLLRFTGITVAFFLYFRTTEIDRFILALRSFRLPYSAALVVSLAFRFIPYMIELYGNIRSAHTLRRPAGASQQSRSPLRRLRRIFPTLVSVLIHAIKTIPGLAMALESRGFPAADRRSVFRALPPTRNIRGQMIVAAAVIAALLAPLWLPPLLSLCL
jgi:energy-coupling factor transport system permease protein